MFREALESVLRVSLRVSSCVCCQPSSSDSVYLGVGACSFASRRALHQHGPTNPDERLAEKFTVVQTNAYAAGTLRKCSERAGVSFHMRLSWGRAG